MTERNFKVYFGGQIKKESRGNRAIILTSAESEGGARIYNEEVGSDNFIFLTGVSTIQGPLERVYIGANTELMRKLGLETDNMRKGAFSTKALDEFIVIPNFIY